jgi:hypothetical protein
MRIALMVRLVVFSLALAGVSKPTRAGLVTGLFNTGVSDGRELLSDLAVDPHYSVVVLSPGSVGSASALLANSDQWPIGSWFPNGRWSKWIQPDLRSASSRLILTNDPNARQSDADYRYTTRFEIDPHTNLQTVRIEGRFAADNGASISLNGVVTGYQTAYPYGFRSFTPFVLTSNFQHGMNTLEFLVRNQAQSTGNPTGLRVEFAEVSAVRSVPEPASVFGLAGLLLTLSMARYAIVNRNLVARPVGFTL